MNVKVIEIGRNYPFDPDSAVFSSDPPKPAEIESALREWLNDNPNASIEHVAQTPISPSSAWGETRGLLVTIFYRD